MKSEINKKLGLSASLATFLWLPFKTLWDSSEWLITFEKWSDSFGYWVGVQGIYWVPNYERDSNHMMTNSLKRFDFILVIVTFFVWIISFFKIRKIKDRDLKSRKIRRTLWLISVLLFLAILSSLLIWMLNDDIFNGFF